MGRGLSDLQSWILTEAGRRKHLCHADVLYHFFRFEPEFGLSYEPSAWEEGGSLKDPTMRRFDPAAIGRSRYRVAQASLSRACARLESRGLVSRVGGAYTHWSGVAITQKGREWLSVNLVP